MHGEWEELGRNTDLGNAGDSDRPWLKEDCGSLYCVANRSTSIEVPMTLSD